MKRILLYIVLCILTVTSVSADDFKEYFSVGNPIGFCGEKYYFKWSTDVKNYYFVQEYLPEGQTFDDYTKLFTVSVMFTDLTAEDVCQSKIDWVLERKKTDMVCNYRVFENDGEYMLDFIASEGTDKELTQVERNIIRYSPIKLNGQNAVLQCYYTSRAYGDDITPFIQAIAENSETLYNALITLQLTPRFIK